MDFYPPLRKSAEGIGIRRIRWEYTAITLEAEGSFSRKNLAEDKTIGELNRLGEEGWEVVVGMPVARTGAFTAKTATYAFSFILKRQVID